MNILSKLAEIPKFFGLSEEYDDGELKDYEEKPKDNLEKEEATASSSFFRQPIRPVEEKRVSNSSRQYQTERTNKQNEYTQNNYSNRENKVVSLENSKYASKQLRKQEMIKQSFNKIAVLEPRTYTEAKNIAKSIFRSEVVIVNFHLMEESQARRIVDFLTGAVYALDGDIQRIGDEMFLCTPPNTEIDSTIAKSILGTQFTEY